MIISSSELQISYQNLEDMFNRALQREISEWRKEKDEFFKDPFNDDADPKMMSTITGKMQKLYLGSEYSVTAKLEYNKKYDSWQYTPISITANTPKDYAAQLLFLKAMINESI